MERTKIWFSWDQPGDKRLYKWKYLVALFLEANGWPGQNAGGSCNDFVLLLISWSLPLGPLPWKQSKTALPPPLPDVAFSRLPGFRLHWAHFHPCCELITKNPEMQDRIGNTTGCLNKARHHLLKYQDACLRSCLSEEAAAGMVGEFS